MKKASIKNLSTEELRNNLKELQISYDKLVLSHKVSTIENPIQIRDLRRNIAKIHTEITNKQ